MSASPRQPNLAYRALAEREPDGRIVVMVGAGVYWMTDAEALRLVEKVTEALASPVPAEVTQ